MAEKQQEVAMQRRRKRQQEADAKEAKLRKQSIGNHTISEIIEKLKEGNRSLISVENEAPTAVPENEKGSALFINSLQKEVQLMMRLNHPNIIKIYQVIESEKECYIVMEHAKGELTDYLSVRERLSEPETRKFFRQLVSAIDHCHEADVVHRGSQI